MVYGFTLPTTSHLSFQACLSSNTHPSLPQAASTARHALRIALKTHKRLPRGPQQDAHLTSVLNAVNDYLPYLFALSHGLSGKPVGNNSNTSTEEVEIVLHAEVEPEWRTTLSSTSPLASLKSPNTSRARGRGIDFEIGFVLTTLGYVLGNLAHTGVVRTLYAPKTPTAEQRTTAVQTATRHLLQASAVHSLASACVDTDLAVVPDINPTTQTALSSLTLAEATLLAVLKDDSYVATCIQSRNPNDKDWMVRAPEIPKVRAMLFARLCVRAAEYAEQAAAGLGSVGPGGKGGVEDELVKYARMLGRVARARACRFFGVDAELAGKVGDGIAWLRAAKGALGLRNGPTGVMDGGNAAAAASKRNMGLSRLKREWAERREERKTEKDAGGRDREKSELDPGDHAGREEEGRVIEMLETKWVRMNDTVSSSFASCYICIS